MEACFENRYTITKKLYLHWVNHSSARILSAIICSIFLVICTGLFISSIVNMYGFVAPFYLFFMLLGLYLIFLHTRIVAAKQFDRLALLQVVPSGCGSSGLPRTPLQSRTGTQRHNFDGIR